MVKTRIPIRTFKLPSATDELESKYPSGVIETVVPSENVVIATRSEKVAASQMRIVPSAAPDTKIAPFGAYTSDLNGAFSFGILLSKLPVVTSQVFSSFSLAEVSRALSGE